MGKSDRVLVINDAPDLKSRLDRWLMRRKVVYTLVATDDEARERLDSESYDLWWSAAASSRVAPSYRQAGRAP